MLQVLHANVRTLKCWHLSLLVHKYIIIQKLTLKRSPNNMLQKMSKSFLIFDFFHFIKLCPCFAEDLSAL